VSVDTDRELQLPVAQQTETFGESAQLLVLLIDAIGQMCVCPVYRPAQAQFL